jgi:5-methylthioadenosine/S-adenosylhomocysteine deaminase
VPSPQRHDGNVTTAREWIVPRIADVTAITLDPRRRIITDAAIVIDGNRIVAIGKTADVLATSPAVKRIDSRE